MPMLVLAGKVLDSGLEDGEKERGLVGVQKEALETSLSLLLDHFTYLQGTQGNQKKVCTVGKIIVNCEFSNALFADVHAYSHALFKHAFSL